MSALLAKLYLMVLKFQHSMCITVTVHFTVQPLEGVYHFCFGGSCQSPQKVLSVFSFSRLRSLILKEANHFLNVEARVKMFAVLPEAT